MLPPAAQLILEAWIGIGLLLIGIGTLFRSACGAPASGSEGVFRSFWFGWAVLLFALQVWHFFLPVDRRALAVMGGAATLGLLLGWRAWRGVVRGIPRAWLALLLLIPSALWLSNRALGGPRFGDVGLYHIPVVQWDSRYAIIPGLGNLFVPFGHNLSYFLYVALLDAGGVTHLSAHLANSVLLLALMARGLLGLDRVWHLRRGCRPDDVFYALALPVLALQAVGIFLTSPSPDEPISLFGVLLCGELMRFVGRRPAGRVPDFDVVAMTLLATAALTVKLSIAGLAAAVLVVTIVYWLWRDRPAGRAAVTTLAAVVALATLGVGLWGLGNIILTGCPLYPSAVGALPVEWRVRVDAVKWIDAAVNLGGPLWQVIRDWRWFLRRMDSLGWNDRDVLLPLAIGLAATVWTVLVRIIRRHPAARRVPMIVLVPPLLSFAFCFANVPMPRYLGATLWILAVDSLVLAIGTAAFGAGNWGRMLVAGIAVSGVAAVLLTRGPVLLPLRAFEPWPAPQVEALRLDSGLVVQYPKATQTCWDAPLPCTPNPDPALRLRRPGDLASGFVIDQAASRHASGG